MRIAQCSDSFLPIENDVERMVYGLAASFGEGSNESYVIAPMCDTGFRAAYPFEILDFLSIRLPAISSYHTGVAAMDRHYLTRLDNVELDIVHAHSPGFSGLEAARIADTRHIPLIGTYHGSDYREFAAFLRGDALVNLAKKYTADFYSRCDLVFTLSEAARDELMSFGYEGSIEVLTFPGYGGAPGPAGDASWNRAVNGLLERYSALTEIESFRLTRKRGLFRKELQSFDRSLEKRKAILTKSFLQQDMQHIYSYAYTRQHNVSKGHSTPLPRAKPEQMGIRPLDLMCFFHAVDADTEAGVQSMLVMRHGNIIAEGYWSPNEKRYPHLLFSMSKSITSTAIGMLVDEKKLMLTEKLTDLFSEKIENPDEHPMKDVMVWHLLTMSTGVRFDEVGTVLGTDWVQEFLDSGVRFEPGSQFYYNSMNTYMLSAIVRKKAGTGMLDYLKERLFGPLGIKSASWEVCPMGIEKGGWGLSLTIEDAAKVGQLYLNKGMWQGKRILSREWIEQATSKQIDTPNGECTDGYGYQIWMTPQSGSYLFNGAFGQYVLIMPGHDALAAVFSGSARLFSKGGLMEQADHCFKNASDHPLEESAAEAHMLESALSGLTCITKQGLEGLMPMPISWLATKLSGTYKLDGNITGVMPFVIQCLHNVFAEGISSISFKEHKGGLEIIFREGGFEYTLHACGGAFTKTSITIREEVHPVGVGAVCGLSYDAAIVLRLYVYFLTTPCTRVITFLFDGKSLKAEFDEIPSAKDASLMLLELTGLTQTELFRRIMPVLKREKLQQQLKEFAITRVAGELIDN